MYKLMKNSILDFRFAYKKLLSFELMYMFFTSFLLIPTLAYISNRLIRVMGASSFLNSEVYKIGLSYSGLIGMITISLLSVCILFIQFGVLIVMAQRRYFKQPIHISDAMITTVLKIPKLFGLGVIQLFLFLLFIIPIVDSPLSTAVFANINRNIFLTSKIYSSNLFLFLYIIVVCLVIYLIIRWIFTVHIILIEGQSVGNALKRSLALTKNNKLRIFIYLILLNVIIYFAIFLAMSVISYVSTLMGVNTIRSLIESYLITFSTFMTLVFTVVLTPINVIFITRLYYRFQKNQGEKIADHLEIHQNYRLNTIESKTFTYFHRRKYVLIIIVAFYMTSLYAIHYYINDNIVYLKWNIAVAGHRGDIYNAPENSISGIKSAIDKGLDAVEIDVQMTKDGVIVLNHDATLKRVAGSPERVSELTYKEILTLDIGSHFSEEFAGERIPTLEQVLQVMEAVKGEVKLIIEIKPYGTGTVLEEKVVRLIERYDMVENGYIQSFEYSILQEIRKINPEIKIGQILYYASASIFYHDVDFYTINQSMLSERFIMRAHKREREVWVWTVNIERNIREVLKYDINGIITDYPEKVQDHLGLK